MHQCKAGLGGSRGRSRTGKEPEGRLGACTNPSHPSLTLTPPTQYITHSQSTLQMVNLDGGGSGGGIEPPPSKRPALPSTTTEAAGPSPPPLFARVPAETALGFLRQAEWGPVLGLSRAATLPAIASGMRALVVSRLTGSEIEPRGGFRVCAHTQKNRFIDQRIQARRCINRSSGGGCRNGRGVNLW